ncbi:membrane bound O-acyl transferase family-domain-containing protein, partial [Lasiosphaeria miniovina]
YRAAFDAAVAAQQAKPLVVPYAVTGAVIIPVLYLSTPHRTRPWLYRLRFAVGAAVVALNARVLFADATSARNLAVAYAVGLMLAWGTIWPLIMLLLLNPQFTAARVQKRKRASADAHAVEKLRLAPDESIAAVAEAYEHYWQPFPEGGTFLDRLDWVWDLYSSFRGVGWNWAAKALPGPPQPKEKPLPGGGGITQGELVRLDAMPVVSRAGFRRMTTRRVFVRDRLAHIAWSYLVLDALSVAMARDPFFVLGPEYEYAVVHPLPAALAALPLRALAVWRSVCPGLAILAAMYCYGCTWELTQFSLSSRTSTNRELWRYPSLFGSAANVLERGLAGFWGGFWHQSFRVAFSAPAAWLVRAGYLRPGGLSTKAVEAVAAFALSGALHAAGSFSAAPRATKPLRNVLFFVLSGAGIVAQTAFCRFVLPPVRRRWWCPSRPVRHAANLAYALAWLHATRWAFLDDMSRAGLFIYAPLPASPLRFLGCGFPGEHWWRWDATYLPRWYSSPVHWWESGIAI